MYYCAKLIQVLNRTWRPLKHVIMNVPVSLWKGTASIKNFRWVKLRCFLNLFIHFSIWLCYHNYWYDSPSHMHTHYLPLSHSLAPTRHMCCEQDVVLLLEHGPELKIGSPAPSKLEFAWVWLPFSPTVQKEALKTNFSKQHRLQPPLKSLTVLLLRKEICCQMRDFALQFW